MPKRKDSRKLFAPGSEGEALRNRIADSIKRENPGIPDDRKFAIATTAAKKKLKT